MKKAIYTVFSLLILSSLLSSAQNFNKIRKSLEKKIGVSTQGLSEEEVASGLKEALTKGVEKGVDQLAKPDGFYRNLEVKIPLPEEAKEVEDKLRKIGQGQKVDETIESLNRAAEDASSEAKDIFISAIRKMELSDALNILNGENNAATQYLEKTTRAQLVAEFKPIIKVSLDKVGATRHWDSIFTTYNKIPFVTKVNPDLLDYTTNKAIDGLFILIAKEELEIRTNPAARVTELLRKVFT